MYSSDDLNSKSIIYGSEDLLNIARHPQPKSSKRTPKEHIMNVLTFLLVEQTVSQPRFKWTSFSPMPAAPKSCCKAMKGVSAPLPWLADVFFGCSWLVVMAGYWTIAAGSKWQISCPKAGLSVRQWIAWLAGWLASRWVSCSGSTSFVHTCIQDYIRTYIHMLYKQIRTHTHIHAVLEDAWMHSTMQCIKQSSVI